MLRLLMVTLLMLSLIPGCGGDDTSPGSSSPDAGADTAADAGETGVDSGTDSATEAAAGELSVSETSLDFGLQACGESAPEPMTLTLTNTGETAIGWTAGFDPASPFGLDGDDSGDLDPGASTTLTITAPEVPATTTAGAEYDGTLTIESDPPGSTITVDVGMTAAGGVLVLSPATADVGLIPVGTSGQLPLALSNQGNLDVVVSIEQPLDDHFSLDWTGAPASVTLAPGQSVADLMAEFVPTDPVSVTTTAALTVSSATCGASVTTIPIEGEGTNGDASVQPGTLDFGSVDCGTTAASQTITIENTGNGAFDFTASLALGSSSPYDVAPPSGTVEPGQTETVTVTPKAVSGDTVTSPDGLADTLVIETTEFDGSPFSIALHQTARGARLAFAPSSIAFGDVPLTSSTQEPFTIVNTGNQAATVTLGVAGAAFTVDPTDPIPVEVGGSESATATFTPTQASAQSGSITLSVATGDVLCAPSPTLALSGRGTNGAVAVSATALDFGTTDCGDQAAEQTFTISNTGTNTYSWDAVLGGGAGSSYSLSPSSGSLNPGEAATVTVTPLQIPPPPASSSIDPGGFDGMVTITTTVVGDTPHEVELRQTAQGAVLSFLPSGPLDFGDVPVSQYTSFTFRVLNEGTADAYVVLDADSPEFTLSEQGFFVPAQTYYEVEAVFSPVTAGTATAVVTATPDTSVVICAPAPTLSLQGTGTSGSVLINPAAIDFGRVPCGQQQVDAQTLTISNVGTLAFDFTVQLSGGNHDFSLSTMGGTVAPSSDAQVLVTPQAMPMPGIIDDNFYGDQLTIYTDIPGDSPHVVPIRLTAEGAIIELSTGGISFPDTSVGTSTTYQFTSRNLGNHAAEVSFVVGQAGIFTFSPQGQNVTPGAQYTVTSWFNPAGVLTYSDTAQVTVPAGTPICAELPSAGMLGTGVP